MKREDETQAQAKNSTVPTARELARLMNPKPKQAVGYQRCCGGCRVVHCRSRCEFDSTYRTTILNEDTMKAPAAVIDYFDPYQLYPCEHCRPKPRHPHKNYSANE